MEAARTQNPRLAVAWANLAHVYWLQKNPMLVREVGQQLNIAPFTQYNRLEPQALSLIARMYARILWEERNFDRARDTFCYALRFNPFDKNLRDEITEFFKQNRDQVFCPE